MAVDLEGDINSAPAVNAEAKTLDDNTDVIIATLKGGNTFPRAFIADADGVLSIVNGNGQVVAITVIKGLIYPIVAKRYRSTGTTGVSGVVALG